MHRVGAATDTAAHRMDSATAGTEKRGGWTDASILGFTRAANMGEVEEGRLGERKATNPAVKAYARQIVADHQALLTEGQTLARKITVAADTTADDVRDVMKSSRDEVKDLTDKKPGRDWDEDFVEKQIDGHKKVLDKLQDAAKNTTNADLRAALEKASGKVQQHLTKAQDLKDNQLKA
ncbi:MAG: DUF4142 domain-containing protein [Gemmatimonadaceae bacterium]